MGGMNEASAPSRVYLLTLLYLTISTTLGRDSDFGWIIPKMDGCCVLKYFDP